MKFVIVGLGSIGKRHQQILEDLNHEVVPVHRDDDLKKLLEKEKPEGVLICNPTSLHIPTALIVAELGFNIFLEKPISHNLDGVDQLLQLIKQKKLVLQVGYNLRFQSGLKQIKQQLERKTIGKIYSARIEAGSFLPDWHPDEDYRQSYSAKKHLGGGVLLDLSHEIDYAVWFFGKAKKVSALVIKIPALKIETEALAELIVEFESGAMVSIHLDYLQKKYKRSCEIVGEKGSFVWDFISYKPEDLNETYIAEMRNFIEAVKGEAVAAVNGNEAKHVLEIIEAAKKSSQSGKIIKL